MSTCLNCGSKVKNRTNRQYIKSCPNCTRLFPDKVRDEIDKEIKEFLRW